MPDIALSPAPKKRGPKTPEGKARSRMNALRHGLWARAFGLLPEDDPAEWTQHVLDLEAGYGPTDATERKLVEAIAVAMWRELRADRYEAETLLGLPPRGPGRSHGGDPTIPEHAAALGTALRYQAGAGAATRRALRSFLEHRKAKQQGLLLPAGRHEPDHEKDTNDLSAPLGRAMTAMPPPEPPSPPEPEPPEPDPDAWLAEIPVVESDPSKESLRRALLGMIEHPILRRMAGQGPLEGVEQLVVCDDPVAYEEWFAKQPKVPFAPLDLPDSIVADIAEVTRHNPPWMRGEYLSYYRPPVPAHLFAAEAANDPEPLPAPPETAPPAPANAIPALRGRIARLLDRGLPRLPEELDLAEAICAVQWPKWPAYHGPIDLALLRRALLGTVIEGPTLNWLGGTEIVQECAPAAGDRPARGP